MVDWQVATALGSRIAGAGPEMSPTDAASVVAELRAGADRSTGLVREFTGLVAEERTAPVLVVDRPGWIRANAEAFSALIEPLVAKIAAKRGAPSPAARAIGARVTGAELGLVLGFLGGKVLGQFDPFFEPTGRLLLVAPNIVHVERELAADPTDFRLWVCLHEETHRVQFTAVPWMRGHLSAEIGGLLESVEPTAIVDDLVARVSGAVRGEAGSLLDVVSTPAQREILDRLTGVMSLLEGHADVVMDGVGPEVIGSVEEIRRTFNRRRRSASGLDRLLRRLLGMEAKMAQYRDGAKFVRAVVDRAGMAEFNAVWERPEHLPTKAEIAEPDAWVARVLG
ncbi:MAG: zinc-dependent metalloprotease [Nocardioides sp.]